MARAEYSAGSIRKRARDGGSCGGVRRAPATGRLRYVSRSVRGSKKQAVAALAALVTEVGAGVPGQRGSTPPSGELVEQRLELKRDTRCASMGRGGP